MKNFIHTNIQQALLAAFLVLTLLCSLYFVIEPQVSRAVSGTPFSVRQEIIGEISFLVQAASLELSGDLNGLTGGNATGTTQAVVQTNSAGGYYMDIAFSDPDGDGTIMRRDLGGTFVSSIKNYSTSTSYNRMVEPSFNFSFASTASMFAYTVTATDTNDVDQSFLNNSTICNAGSDATPNLCWMAPSTTAFRIIDRDTSAPQGATSTIRFRVYVPANPNPGVEAGFYTATATLSAYAQ